MSPENKQRLVGIIVIIAFIALLIPFLFTNGIKKKSKGTATELPIVIEKKQYITKQPPNQQNGIATEQPLLNTQHQTQLALPPPNDVLQPLPPAQPDSTASITTDQNNTEINSIETNSSNTENLGSAQEDAILLTKAMKNNKDIKKPTPTPIKNKVDVTKKPGSVVIKKAKVTKNISKNKKEFWSVQIGSFSDQIRIQNLISELHTKGFHIFIQKIKTSNKILTRILVGSEINKENANQIAKQLETMTKIKGHVVRNYK